MSASGDLRISIVQSNLQWEGVATNRSRLAEQMAPLAGVSDVVVLPEMFTTGFSMDSQRLAETMEGPSIAWMAEQAQSLDAVVTGSMILEESGSYFNRLVWMKPDGSYEVYDKRHLFRMASEEAYFTGGNKPLIVEWRGWKIRPLVCYDLRFPVWSRNRYSEGEASYDALIYVANWPEARRSAWQILLRARAHENQAYVIGVNRVGEDGKGISYAGDSAIVSPKGVDLASVADFQEGVATVSLSKSELDAYREKFPTGLDADDFHLNT